jgi:hypothetical protein
MPPNNFIPPKTVSPTFNAACPNSACAIFVTFPTIPIDPKPNGEGEEDKLEFGFENFYEADDSHLLDETCGEEEGDGEA